MTKRGPSGSSSHNSTNQESDRDGQATASTSSRNTTKKQNKRKSKFTNLGQNKQKTKRIVTVRGVTSTITDKLFKEMKYLQTTTFDLIPKMSFCRLVHEIMQQYGSYRIQSEALRGIQAATEMYLIQYFEDANKCTYHAKRKTLKAPDFGLVNDLRVCFESFH